MSRRERASDGSRRERMPLVPALKVLTEIRRQDQIVVFPGKAEHIGTTADVRVTAATALTELMPGIIWQGKYSANR